MKIILQIYILSTYMFMNTQYFFHEMLFTGYAPGSNLKELLHV